MAVLNLVLFAISFALLIVSGDLAVKLLSRVAALLRMKDFVLGFFLVGFGTSLPELFVGITSAFEGNPVLSLGNVIGSNIVNLTLILGVLVVLGRGLRVGRRTAKRDMVFMLLISSLPVFLLLDGSLSRVEGLALLLAFAIYLFRTMNDSNSFSLGGGYRKIKDAGIKGTKDMLLLAASFAALLLSADFVVKFGVALALDLNVSVMLVGLIAVAFGTSLPELVFSVRAAAAKKGGMALGNLAGSGVVNSTVVLGATSAIRPIVADYLLFVTSATFMIVVMFLVVAIAERRGGFSARDGVMLVMLYALFMAIEVFFRGV